MICTTDRSMYSPGETVTVQIQDLPAEAVDIRYSLYHLDELVWQKTESPDKQYSFVLLDSDFTGYLLDVEALDAQDSAVAHGQIGIDCSSVWTKFPRYGYVWDFTNAVNAEEKINAMSRYHINAIQFYDWQYRHHQPIADDLSAWKDWSGRMIYGDSIRRYIDAAHGKNMACMAYNMIYAANMTYLTDGSGIDPSWRLVKQSGQDFTCDMDAKLGPVGVLQYFNLLNPKWQEYIFTQENKVFNSFDFDGWHGDTIGENGVMQTPDGQALGFDANGKPIVYVKDGYTQFLNAAKKAVGDKYLTFNPVGAQGIENVNISNVDALYTEFWPWDSNSDGLKYDSYYSIHKAITQAQEQSGGKSLVVAAYINYRNPKSSFNEPAVRMMDSVIFASGGAHIELGNGDCMLSDEYFPNDGKKKMRFDLPEHVERLYEFLVAYENLLRDGQRAVSRAVKLESVPVSIDGKPDTVWCFAKQDNSTEVYNFINLIGTDSGWRDEKQLKKAPAELLGINVRIYTECKAQSVFLASPDRSDIRPIELEHRTGADEQGCYIEFIMPELAYWNMVFLR